ncbi:MAG: hypothetical protein HY921_02300 [Elusimicrobia bacterium]|nr:hypothetical protein [Elusimicrobiota bacterium]
MEILKKVFSFLWRLRAWWGLALLALAAAAAAVVYLALQNPVGPFRYVQF